MIRKKLATSGAILALACGLFSGVVSVPAAYAEPESTASSNSNTVTKKYADGAAVTFPSTWSEGEPIEFSGTGFLDKEGNPSVVAVRINGAGVNKSDYLQFTADADGKIEGSIPWQDSFTTGSSVDINVLTGALNEKDPQRSGTAATVNVVSKDGSKDSKETKKPSESSSASAESKTDKASESATPEGSQGATVQGSGSSDTGTATETQAAESTPASDSSSSNNAVAAQKTNDTGQQNPLLWVGYGLIGLGVIVAILIIVRNMRKKS